jgi:uncharacterized protein YlxP (DUF503 family)
MHVGALTLELRLPGCTSLKEKRSRLKPLLAALHREFNLSAAEIEHNDSHALAVIACVAVANEKPHVERVLGGLPSWVERNRPDLQVIDHQMTFL